MSANFLRNSFVLPEDLLIIPVADLPQSVRDHLGDDHEEFALTRPHAREPSKLIDAAAADLIENFRKPHTIVQAVITYSRKVKLDPEQALDDALPLLRQLIGTGLLVPEGDDGAKRIDTTFQAEDDVAGYRIIRCVQVLEDSELYQARDASGAFVALKIARTGHEETLRPRLNREVTALRRIDGLCAPRLLADGEHQGRPFIALSWVTGTDALSAAAELRDAGNRADLLQLLRSVAEAYAALHRLGVLHGDVHPGNLMIGRDGHATLLDFGLALVADLDLGPHPRGGIGFFIEPELATSVLAHQPPSPATARSEQFAVAALLYLIAAGHHYVDFNLQQDEMLRQICDDAALPFADRGVVAWPALETVLARGLAKAAAARHPDMSAFAAALADIAPDRPAPAVIAREGRDALLASTIEYLDWERPLFRDGLPHGPLCSVNFGASGIAYALYRMACLRDEPRLLAMADAWVDKAAADAGRDEAFVNREMDMTPEIVGRVSPYHSRCGLHLVQALIAAASGEREIALAAVRAFSQTAEEPCAERDLTLGRSGTVLAAALLLEALPDLDGQVGALLRDAGTRRLETLWDEVAGFDALTHCPQWANLGIAHGWAGLLYATLRWHLATGTPLPASFEERLMQVFACGRPRERGLEWPWRQGPDYRGREMAMPGWCNGAAGFVHLACLAHRVLHDARWIDVAIGAGWQSWEGGDGPVDLCCGLSGRAHALLDLHRATGDAIWLTRANILIDRAVTLAPDMRTKEHPRHSLYKGELGLALSIAEFDAPDQATMALFGEAGRG